MARKSTPDNGGAATAEPKTRKRKSKADQANDKLARIVNLIGWFLDRADLSEAGEGYVIQTLRDHSDNLTKEWGKRRNEAEEGPKQIEIRIPE